MRRKDDAGTVPAAVTFRQYEGAFVDRLMRAKVATAHCSKCGCGDAYGRLGYVYEHEPWCDGPDKRPRRPLTAEEKARASKLDKIRRSLARLRGLCSLCAKRPAEHGYRRCDPCRHAQTAVSAKYQKRKRETR
ncbi:MAG TPA: hypothetical protein VD931_00030 [Baekduia sp.]|nr:hypothetical protein [Baekduia sp.]